MINQMPGEKLLTELHVAEVARETGVTRATVRYYTRIGMLNPHRNPHNGYQCFSTEDLHRIYFIRKAQSLGLTIRDIKALFATMDQGEVTCKELMLLAKKRLENVEERILKLEIVKTNITQILKSWESMEDQTLLDGNLNLLIEQLSVFDSHAVYRIE